MPSRIRFRYINGSAKARAERDRAARKRAASWERMKAAVAAKYETPEEAS